MFRMTDHRIRKRITDKQTNAGEMIENKIGNNRSISTECKNKAEGRHNSISTYRNSSNLANLKIANSPTEDNSAGLLLLFIKELFMALNNGFDILHEKAVNNTRVTIIPNHHSTGKPGHLQKQG